MGLFDKFSKKKDDDEEEKTEDLEAVNESAKEEEKPEKPQETADAAKKNEAAEEPAKPTRFTLVVENVFVVDENESIAAVGNLHGKLNAGDKFWIIHPKFPQGILATAETLVVGEETPETAENCRLAIKMTEVTDPGDIPRFAVISNIQPQMQPERNTPVENPFLIGLTCEYNRLVKDNEFTYTFMVALLTARYITPADMQIDTPDPETGKVRLKDSKISFKLLHHPNDDKQLVLPIFTDMAALSLWKAALETDENGEKPKTVLMPFDRCADIGTKNGGLVVNPFGPAPVFVSNQNIENTLKMGQQAVERQKTLDALNEKK